MNTNYVPSERLWFRFWPEGVARSMEYPRIPLYRLEQLKREVEVVRHAYELLKEKAEESRITTAQETEDVRLVSSAVVPGKKVAPQRSLIAIVAAIVGFLLLSLAVILFEYRAQMA